MKKVAFFAVLFSMITINAKAQWFDFSQNMSDFSIGVDAGVVGYHFGNGQIDKTYNGFGYGLNASLLGFYVDFIYQRPEHRWDRTVTQVEYDDHTALTINVGYKIPILPWLSLTPLIGYSNETTGKTLGNSIGVDTERHSIYHDYKRETINNHFNYGAGLTINPISWLEFGGICTAHALYGKLAINFMRFKK